MDLVSEPNTSIKNKDKYNLCFSKVSQTKFVACSYVHAKFTLLLFFIK